MYTGVQNVTHVTLVTFYPDLIPTIIYYWIHVHTGFPSGFTVQWPFTSGQKY